MRKYKFNERLLVEWVDMVEDPKWTSESEMMERPEADCATLGFFHHVDKEFLYLSNTVSGPDRTKSTIPLGTITKIRIQVDK
jgi:hypothetical protein